MPTYYALTARGKGKLPRTCALIPAASIEDAGRSAQELWKSGALGFVERPSRFRVRMATRTETSLMGRFLASCAQPGAPLLSGSDFDSMLARRQRLIQSFFLALYLDPKGLKERLRGVSLPPSPASTPGSSGGNELAPPIQESQMVGAESPSFENNGREGVITNTSSIPRADAPIGAQNQEDALASILQSPEANDGGAARTEGLDLDDLF